METEEAAVRAARELLAAQPRLGNVLARVLERRERQGRMPRRMTVDADPATAEALGTLLSERAVHPAGHGRVRLELAVTARRLGPDGWRRLERLFYDAIERRAHDPAAEHRAHASELVAALAALEQETASPASRAFLAHVRGEVEAGTGELLQHALRSGVEEAVREARTTVRCIDGVLANRHPLRVQAFAAQVCGSSKALRRGSELLRRVTDALYEHDPTTRGRVHELGDPPTVHALRARVLEAHGIYQDVAAASVLCFGPLRYAKGTERFDHIAQHASLGECARLIHQQLWQAELAPPYPSLVTVIENETPFFDYVDAVVQNDTAAGGHVATDELIVCSGGQANLAVVRLLSMLAAQSIPIRHSGDLDRAGVVILRSLRERVGAHVTPLCMSPELHRRYRDRGRELDDEERKRVSGMLSRDDPSAPGHELLQEIARSGVWIEQEAFSDEELVPLAVGSESALRNKRY